jgi:hypothetical protein
MLDIGGLFISLSKLNYPDINVKLGSVIEVAEWKKEANYKTIPAFF